MLLAVSLSRDTPPGAKASIASPLKSLESADAPAPSSILAPTAAWPSKSTVWAPFLRIPAFSAAPKTPVTTAMIKPNVIAYSAVDCAFLNLTSIIVTPSMNTLFFPRPKAGLRLHFASWKRRKNNSVNWSRRVSQKYQRDFCDSLRVGIHSITFSMNRHRLKSMVLA